MEIPFSFIDRIIIPDYDTPKGVQGGNLEFNELCKECGTCIRICPGGCLQSTTTTKMDIINKLQKGKKGIPYVISTQRGTTLCVSCFDCGAACPQQAISIRCNFNPQYFFKRLTQLANMQPPKRY
ncbi:MAG TPA: 4Fe-4S dicluster domain-containing protein [Spirochaetota bacterium]|nr:4Fe-4S dicluster domain-containing protein [Spirochaetota bacterium]HOM11147.1 4Fe-4S dicluster domain-containing protein [Spirochaetota bacterium]HPP50922.1 4Fe-4S dicluster domain-containing protein [Spirochaetota bacterium]